MVSRKDRFDNPIRAAEPHGEVTPASESGWSPLGRNMRQMDIDYRRSIRKQAERVHTPLKGIILDEVAEPREARRERRSGRSKHPETAKLRDCGVIANTYLGVYSA